MSELTYIADKQGERFAVIVPVGLWKELTGGKDLDTTAVIVPVELWEELTGDDNLDATDDV